MARLTKTLIDGAKPPAKGYEIHWDDRVPGYGLRVTANGVRSFVAQGRVRGKAVILTIGRYGLFTEEQARKKAQSLLQQMRDGHDPRDAKRQEDAEKVTLRQVADAYFARPNMLKESTRTEMDRHIEKVFTAWRGKPIKSITQADCRKRYNELATKGLNGKKPAPASAKAAMVTLRTLMNFARDEYRLGDGTPLIEHNPVAGLRKELRPSDPRDHRFIPLTKVGEVWNKLTEARADPFNADALAAIDLTMFCLLMGTRRMEAASLEWSRVSLDKKDPAKRWFHLPDPKNGREVFLPLSSQAADLLRERRKGTNSKFVFPSWGKTGHIMDARKPMELVSEIAGKHLSLHDLRRTWTNIALRECRIGKFETDLLTNHVPGPRDVTATYYLDTTHLQWLAKETQAVSDWVVKEARAAATKQAA